jgi:NAD(P)-dependent dehydrogenase (short-subunit alcohol dehydrogenase family)
MKNFSIEGQVVIVTGGAGLIGTAFCEMIAANGGTAVICDIGRAPAEELAASLCAAHGPRAAIAYVLDITRADQVGEMVADVDARFGRIDALVNNAYPRHEGYGRRVEEIEYEHFCLNVGHHVGGYFLCSQILARYFAVHDRGNIINMGSIYGVVAPRFEVYGGTPMTMPVEYAIIKAGILHLTRYLAQYFKPQHIRVNAISPGGVQTDQPEAFVANYSDCTMGRRMLRSSDLQGTLLFLLSNASSHITGQNLIVDDGWTL